MRFTVDFKCDNDAFAENHTQEIARCLKSIGETLIDGCPTDLYQNVLDSNGNIIGTFRLATKGIFA